MSRYNLECHQQHTFEAWFRDAKSYDEQLASKLIECPLCGSSHIHKLPSAPNIACKTNRPQLPANTAENAPPLSAETYHQQAREMVAYIHENFEDVGHKFPEEVRKIHYQETDARHIYGQANKEEIIELHQEGIDCNIIPDFDKAN